VCEDELDFYKEYSLRNISEDRDAWYLMVGEYTSRDMTYQSDKLPALSGVISALQKLTGDTCYAGIWRSWFLTGLMWRIQVPELDTYVFAPKKAQRIGFWRAPSWSWAALEGVILYDILQRYVDSGDVIARLEDCNVVPKGINPLGELESGYAKLKGPLTTLAVAPEGTMGHTSSERGYTIRISPQRHVYSSVYFDLESYDTCDALMITSHTGLAIRPVDIHENTYVRVGAVVL
jgi:hypothetical protein